MNKKKDEKEYKFIGKVIRCVYNSEDFKAYAVEVDKSVYPDIKKNKFGNVSICGELSELSEGIEYEVVATETSSKNGASYKVTNIRRDVPTSAHGVYLFLTEILTANQAKVLYENYPDIIQRVKENRLDDVDLNKLKGIKEYTFNVIVKKIIENFCLADLVIEFRGYISMSVIKKLYNKYTSVEMIRYKLQTNPYKCLCGLAGIGFKTADNILLNIEKVSNQNKENGETPIINFDHDLKTSKERCLACVMYLLEENENEGHTVMNLTELRKEVIQTVPACASYFVDSIKSSGIYYEKEQLIVALAKTFKTEVDIAATIKRTISDIQNVWDFDIEKYRNINGVPLSNEQINGIKNVCQYNISILNGAAGTGKTYSTQAIINMLKDNKKTFRLFSPTGKAAKVLSAYTNEKATTIHRGLAYNPALPNPWTYNAMNKLECDIVIIDEFSMVDIWLFGHVIDAIDFSKTKLLMIGDNAQLCSVGCGNLLHDFMQSGLIPTTTLTKVFRYGEGGLMKIATDTRFCKKYLSADMKGKVTVFGENEDYRFFDFPSETIPENAVMLYKKLLAKGISVNNIQVLTAKNVGDCGTEVLNNMLQKVANKNYGSTNFFKYGNTMYFESDLVIQKQNNYKAPRDLDSMDAEERLYWEKAEETPTAFVANGETGTVKQICNSYILIDFDGIVVKYQKQDMDSISLGYAISIHKSQGSSIDNVILLTPQSHTFMMNSNLLYVGLTRMRKNCYHLGSLSTVNATIVKKANLERNTFMQQLLKTNKYDMMFKDESNTQPEHNKVVDKNTNNEIDYPPEDDVPW